MPADTEFKNLLVETQCYAPESIRAFLRYSRRWSDDNLGNSLPRTGSCAKYLSTELFPEWNKRDTLLDFCESIAKRRQQQSESEGGGVEDGGSVDPRIDAYGARAKVVPQSREDDVLQWVQTERNIESIIRETSAHTLTDKCGSFSTRPEYFTDAYKTGKFK